MDRNNFVYGSGHNEGGKRSSSTSKGLDETYTRFSRSGNGGGGYSRPQKRLLPWSAVIAIDVVLAAIFLGLFSLFYIMLPRDLSGDAVKLPAPSSVSSSKPSPSKGASASPQKSGAEASPSASASENAADANSWRVKFADKFTTGAVEKTDTSYKSANVSIKIDKVEKDDVTYYVADIYLADIKYFRTAYAAGKYQSAGGLHVDKIFAKTEGAILGINGDNSPENVGPIVRNGELHNAKVKMDVLVMNNDGSMETFSPKDFDIEKIKANGAWQMWTFGPMLLKDGQVMTDFNSGVNKTNPRTAIGYYEPGHYCFIVVDGRQSGYSTGYTTEEMSKLFHDMGCKAAFNLDGGQSSEMVYMGKIVNKPYDGSRSVNDMVYIGDE